MNEDNKSKIQYEHEIKLRDDEPVAVHAKVTIQSTKRNRLADRGFVRKRLH